MSKGKRKNKRELAFVEQAIQSALIIKLRALRELSGMLGYLEERETIATALLILIVLQLFDPETLPVQREALRLMLELYDPELLKCEELSGLTITKRNHKEVRRWRMAVLSRDEHRCTECGSSESIEVHHIVRWRDAPHLRVMVENGLSLCERCHVATHSSGSIL